MSISDEIDNIDAKINWHWRDSMRVTRFFAFDSRAATPLPLLLVYFRTSTLTLTIITLLIFRFLEGRGLTVPAALRNLRSWMVGAERPGWLGVRKRSFIDYG